MSVDAAKDAAHGKPSGSAALPDAHASDDVAGWRLPSAVFAGIGLLIGVDVVLDLIEGVELSHILVEAAVFSLSAFGIVALWRRARAAAKNVRVLTTRVSEARAAAAKWQREASTLLQGLGEAIDKQFSEWQFSAAEREIGLLLLKGLPLREIAALRGTSERTVRAQALGVYRKAEVEGRAELSAYFLEDLLLPRR